MKSGRCTNENAIEWAHKKHLIRKPIKTKERIPKEMAHVNLQPMEKTTVLPPNENSKPSKKARRPDMQLYVPRGRRSDTSSGDELSHSNEKLHLTSSPQVSQTEVTVSSHKTAKDFAQPAKNNSSCKSLQDTEPGQVEKKNANSRASKGKATQKTAAVSNVMKPVPRECLRVYVVSNNTSMSTVGTATAKARNIQKSSLCSKHSTCAQKQRASDEKTIVSNVRTSVTDGISSSRLLQKKQCDESGVQLTSKRSFLENLNLKRDRELEQPRKLSVESVSPSRRKNLQKSPVSTAKKISEQSAIDQPTNLCLKDVEVCNLSVNRVSDIIREPCENNNFVEKQMTQKMSELRINDNICVDDHGNSNARDNKPFELHITAVDGGEEYFDTVAYQDDVSTDNETQLCVNDCIASELSEQITEEQFYHETDVKENESEDVVLKNSEIGHSPKVDEIQTLPKSSKQVHKTDRQILPEANTTSETKLSTIDSFSLIKSQNVLDGNYDQNVKGNDSCISGSSVFARKKSHGNTDRSKTDEDSWDSLFDENGDCLNPAVMTELADTLGEVDIQKSKYDYLDFRPHDPDISGEEFSHIVELYDFPAEFKTQDLMAVLSTFKERGFNIKWIDDTHALAVFSSSITATEALSINHPLIKVRPLSQAITGSKWKAKRYAEDLLPYKPRPQTTASLARRLVSGALGLKVAISKEQRDQERQRLQQAKERKRQVAKQKQDVWDGVVS